MSADGVWFRWSEYLDNQAVGGRGFNDTVSVRASAQWQSAVGRQLRLGVAWEPSPVPTQDGRTNFVDNDRLVVSVGGGHEITVRGRAVELSWFAQVHSLLTRKTVKKELESYPACDDGGASLCDELPDDLPRTDTGQETADHAGLQTGNPGFPGWHSWGTLLAFGFDLTWRF